jgi:hypothetical protein
MILEKGRHVHAVEILPGDAGGVLVPGMICFQLPGMKEKITSSALKSRARREIGRGLEFHALAKLEGDLHSIGRNLPALGQAGLTLVVPRSNSTSRL